MAMLGAGLCLLPPWTLGNMAAMAQAGLDLRPREKPLQFLNRYVLLFATCVCSYSSYACSF